MQRQCRRVQRVATAAVGPGSDPGHCNSTDGSPVPGPRSLTGASALRHSRPDRGRWKPGPPRRRQPMNATRSLRCAALMLVTVGCLRAARVAEAAPANGYEAAVERGDESYARGQLKAALVAYQPAQSL